MNDRQHSPNLWNFKPWWCQPWSIILTGIFVTIASWLVIKIVWVSLLVFVAILAWWSYFLVLLPRAIADGSVRLQKTQLSDNFTERSQK